VFNDDLILRVKDETKQLIRTIKTS